MIQVGVFATEKLPDRMQAVEQTWARWASQVAADVVFLLADPTITLPVRDGNRLWLPCPDDYESLPQRTRWFCLWTLANTQATHLFKCDDDTYLHLPRLVEAAQSKRWNAVDCVARRNKIDRFCFHGGAGYLLTRRAMMVVAAHATDLVGAEDYCVGRALKASGLNVLNEGRLNFWRQHGSPSRNNNLISTHYVSPGAMRVIHGRCK